jgi:hypothetical protein
MPVRIFSILLALLTAALPVRGSCAADPAKERPAYGVLYTAWIKPDEPLATVRIRLNPHPEWVRWMRLNAEPERYSGFKGSGEVESKGGRVTWRPPARDAWLQYRVNLQSKRASGRFDGLVTSGWALFRADDLVPPVHLDMEDGTQSKAKLALDLPDGWSAATPFPRYKSGRYNLDNPRRLFDRPIGWLLLGKIGARRETVGGTRLTVAAPLDTGVRRMDMLAFLRWTLPTMQALFPRFPTRLLVVSAGDPMWRGALSGPNSLFVHADRPLISENATSTLLHELVHVAMRAQSTPGADWIVEGLAEYYSLEVLRRSGAISDERFEKAHRNLAEWGKAAERLDVPRSSGARTARAVGALRAIDAEIRSLSKGDASLDDVARAMAEEGRPVTIEVFRARVEGAAGGKVRSIDAALRR